MTSRLGLDQLIYKEISILKMGHHEKEIYIVLILNDEDTN